MSLISLRNAIAPLTNTTHLVTIVLFSVLFGVYRISGGTIRIGSSDISRHSEEVAPRTKLSATGFPPANLDIEKNDLGKNSIGKPPVNIKIPDSGSIRLDANGETDLLKDMIGDEPLPVERQNNANSVKQQRKPIEKHSESNESLDDIEKTLGLR